MSTLPQLILASTSPYRKALLERLRLPFECIAPETDETTQPGEAPEATAQRLAIAKAQAVALRFPQAVVIGSDQVAHFGGQRLDKPGSHAVAAEQLRLLSGKSAWFDTGVCVISGPNQRTLTRVVRCEVSFRALSPQRIERYLALEAPFDCAGSAKSEALGITLIERILTDDPTSLVGLPLIALSEMLVQSGLDPLA